MSLSHEIVGLRVVVAIVPTTSTTTVELLMSIMKLVVVMAATEYILATVQCPPRQTQLTFVLTELDPDQDIEDESKDTTLHQKREATDDEQIDWLEAYVVFVAQRHFQERCRSSGLEAFAFLQRRRCPG